MTTIDSVKDWNPRIRQLTADEWQLYRSIRLQALRDSPEAFGSTAAEAERLTVRDWKRRLESRATFVAEADAQAVGLISGIAGERPGEGELISMWVDPGWRGRGLGECLVETVAGWAVGEGYDRLRLWVAQGNARAEALYRRKGFFATGEVQPMGRDPSRMEFAMVRELRPQAVREIRP